MKTLAIIVVLALCLCGIPALAMIVPSQGSTPPEEEPVHSGGYYTQTEAILYGILICLVIIIIL